MKYARRPHYRRARKYIRRRRTTRKAAKPSRSFVKKVQKIIHKDAETKQAYTSLGDSLINFNSTINSANDMQLILPQIGQGSADNQRIGDEIRAQRLSVKGFINLAVDLTENTLPNRRVAVRMMVVSPKRFPNIDDAYTNWNSWYTSLLKKGGTQVAFTGLLSDLYAPINTDEITKYYDRVFYLSQDYWKTNVGTTTVSSQSMMNISKTIKFFKFTMKLRNKKLRYDAGVSSNLRPTNFGPFLLLGYVHLDGSSPDVVTTQVGLSYDAILDYEDM